MKNSIIICLLFATTFCFAQNISSSSYALDIFKNNGTMAIMVGSTMYAVQIKTTDTGDTAKLAAEAALSVGIKGSNYKYEYHKTMDCNGLKNKFSSIFTVYCGELSSSSSPNTNSRQSSNQTALPIVPIKVFTGTIVNGKKQGYGIHTDQFGNETEGEFTNDLVNGYATVKCPSGSRYEANFVNGKMSGKGKYIIPDGSYCEGIYVNDEMEGLGRCVYANGAIYEGNFLKGWRSGQGIYNFGNGEIHSGEFRYNSLNGNGKQIKKSRYYVVGIFKNGIPVKVKYYNPLNEKVSKSEYEKN